MTTALTLAADATPAPLPPAVAAAVAAFTADTPTVGQTPLADLIPQIGDLLNGAAVLLAHKNALDNLPDLEFMATAVAKLVQFRFAGFKFAELSEAVQRGAGGQYKADAGEVLYLSLPNVSNWLYAYQTTARHQAIKALRVAEEAATLALSAPSRDHAAEVAALVRLAGHGALPPAPELDFGNVLYDWLKAHGALQAGYWPAEVPDYAAIRAEETDALLAEPVPADKFERRGRTGFLNELLAGNWPAGHPLAKTVANACKKRVLREWAMQYAAEEVDPAPILAGLLHAQQQAA